MSASLEELVARFEQIELEQHLDDPEQLPLALAERQSLLTAIQSADTSHLSPELRATLKERLRVQLERDQALCVELEQRRAELQKALEQLGSGRNALRGYGEALKPVETPPRRIG